MTTKTQTVAARLTDDERDQLTRTGLSVREIISIGLAAYRRQTAPQPAGKTNPRPTLPTGELGNDASVRAELDQLRGQLDGLRAQLADLRGAIDRDEAHTEPETPADTEHRQADRLRERASIWHAALLDHITPDEAGERIATTSDAVPALRVSSIATARDRLMLLTGYGLAEELPRAEDAPRTTPRRWKITPR